MARGLNKVDNCMDTVVYNIHAVDLVFGVEVGIKPLLNILDNGIPRFIIVDEITKSRRVNNCQSQANPIPLRYRR